MTEEVNSPGKMPSLVLAYIGDAVYEVLVRNYLIASGLVKVKQLHKAAVGFVKASAQARFIHALEEILTPEELEVVKRGRNAKSGSPPKNTNIMDYRYGTAFEALFGYLFLTGQQSRMEELFRMITELVKTEQV